MTDEDGSTITDDTEQDKGFQARLLDAVERAGNKVPHPVIMFLYLIAGVIVLSAILAVFNVSVTEEVATPVPISEVREIT